MIGSTRSAGGACPTLDLRGYRLRKYVPDLVVDVSFPVGVNALLGVNGVGKTSLLTSLVRPQLRTRASAVHVSRAGRAADLEQERVCLLPQRPILPAGMTVIDLVRYCCHLRKAPTGSGIALLEQLGLSDLAGRRADRLSGGETQRLNLALAFVGDPRIVLLDEPTVALDPLARSQFAEALHSVADDAIVVMSTHVASDLDLADRVFLLGDNGILWQGTSPAFLENSTTGRLDDAFEQLLRQGSR